MKFDRQHQIEQICEATLKRKLEERVSYLSEACGDDTALRLEVDLQLAKKSESSSNANEIASLADAVNAQASTVEFEPSSPGTLDHAPVGETISSIFAFSFSSVR